MFLSYGKWEKGDLLRGKVRERERTSSNVCPCAQTGCLYERVLVEVEDLWCEALKICIVWRIFMYLQECLYLSLCWTDEQRKGR